MPTPASLSPLTKTCDYETIQQFAVLSDDFNPIHVDREFAANSPMGGLIAHGPMSLGLLWRSLHLSLGADAIEGLSLDVRFLRPVRENDVVVAGGSRQAGSADVYDVWVRNQDDDLVISGQAVLKTQVV